MRTVLSIARIGAILILLGCETDTILFTGPYFIRFSESSITKKESFSKPIKIEVHNGGPATAEDILITYKISGSARAGIDYTIAGEPGKITIPKGEYFGSIEIQLINNANNILRAQDIVLTLQSATAGLRVGQGESGIGKIFTFTIVDDCILGGDYIGQRGSVTVNNISITSSDCENYLLSNWNIGVFLNPIEMNLVFIDNGDNTLTIPQQEEETIDDEFATISGTGVVDPLTRNIILTVTLVDYEGQPEITISLVPD